jgi:chaperonin GroEL
MNKEVRYNEDARNLLKQGVDTVANAVKVTLGPKGRNVVIDRDGRWPMITKDGVTVASNVEVTDPLVNVGVQLMKGVAIKTVKSAGDGTTTATVLAQAIFEEGLKEISAGVNPMALKRGIDMAVTAIVEHIKSQSIAVDGSEETLLNVAMVSTNNDKELGGMIAAAMHKVGKYGAIHVEDSSSSKTELKFSKGFVFDKGLIHQHFMTNQIKQTAEFDNPWILLYDKKVRTMEQLIGTMEFVLNSGKPIVIIADEFDPAAMNVIAVNKKEGMQIAPVTAPSYGDLRHHIMEDIAYVTGGKVAYENEVALKKIDFSFLGQADRIIIDQNSTTIIGGKGNPELISARVKDLELAIEAAHGDDDKTVLKARVSNLDGSVATIYVGATTEIEANEKRDRIDDAVHATRAAVEEGFVAGGGVAYIRGFQKGNLKDPYTEDEFRGVEVILKALRAPLFQICENAGVDPTEVFKKILAGEGDFGYNARTDNYENLIAGGVIDPTKVVREALENAASIAGLMLTTECLLLNIK